MTFRVTDTTLLFSRKDYRGAADAIKRAAVGGNFALAARTLEVNYRTMTRWLGTLADQGINVREELQLEPNGGRSSDSKLAGETSEEQKKLILDAVRRAGGAVPAAAEELGVSSQRVYKLIRTLDLIEPVERIRVDPSTPPAVGTRVPTKRRERKPRPLPLHCLLDLNPNMSRVTRRALEQLLDLVPASKRRLVPL